MGGQLSANYDNIHPTFQFGIWKVHSAIHKTTNESVSLWLVDQEKLTKTYTNRSDREQFLDLTLVSLQTMRKLRHPKILKILEVNDKKPDIAFASEPVSSSVSSQVSQMHPMDAAYISFQVAEALSFLNQDARLSHLGLCPNAVVLNDDLVVKLIQFQWSSPIQSNGEIKVPSNLLNSRVMAELKYKPPEILGNKPSTCQVDIFIFGLFLYTLLTGEPLNTGNTAQEILSAMPTRVCAIYNVPEDFKQLIAECLSMEPSVRPNFSRIMQSSAFQSMQLKALRYIDLILTKEPQDKFKFYKGLATKISDFSPNLSKVKILPALIQECKGDVRFAPVLVCPIFKIIESFSNDQFMKIWSQISFLTTITDPPEVLISILKNLPLLLTKFDQKNHKDYIYPIIYTSLQSPHPKIHKECLLQMPAVLNEMNENNIRTLLLPKLTDLSMNSKDSSIIAAAISCISNCLPKIDNDTFATETLPKITQTWQRARMGNVGEAIVEIIERLVASNDVIMTKAIPLAAEIAGSQTLDKAVMARLCDWMISAINRFKSGKSNNQFSSSTTGFTASLNTNSTNVDPDNPFSAQPAAAAHAPTQPSYQPPKQTQTTYAAPKPPVNIETSSDIWGTSPSAPQASNAYKPPPAQPSQQVNLSSTDIWGSSPSTTNNYKPPVQSSTPSNQYKPTNTMPQQNTPIGNIFGNSQSFGAQPKPSQNTDIFRGGNFSSTQMTNNSNDIFDFSTPQQQYQQPNPSTNQGFGQQQYNYNNQSQFSQPNRNQFPQNPQQPKPNGGDVFDIFG